MKGMKESRMACGLVPGVIGQTDIRAYNFIEADEDTVEVEMYGEVVESRPVNWWTGEFEDGMFIVLDDFLKDLNTYKDKANITFRINSVGGHFESGIAIYNRISELKGNTVSIVDGLAASAASLIAQGAKTRKIFTGSQVMVHGVSVFLHGCYNEQELKKMENRIISANKATIELYSERTGKEKDYIKSLIDKEEWMTGKEAIEKGFMDELVETDSVKFSMSADKKIIMVNGITMSAAGLRNMPKDIPIMSFTSGEIPVVIETKSKDAGGRKTMTMEELKQAHPELVQQIEEETKRSMQGSTNEELKNEAIRKERSRLKEIEEIENQIADKNLLNDAKFGEKPMTAPELAFLAMKQQKDIGTSFMTDLMDDANKSGVQNVSPAPNAGQKTAEEQNLEDISNGAALIANSLKMEVEKK